MVCEEAEESLSTENERSRNGRGLGGEDEVNLGEKAPGRLPDSMIAVVRICCIDTRPAVRLQMQSVRMDCGESRFYLGKIEYLDGLQEELSTSMALDEPPLAMRLWLVSTRSNAAKQDHATIEFRLDRKSVV